MGAMLVSINSNNDLFQKRAEEFFSIAIGGGWGVPDLV